MNYFFNEIYYFIQSLIISCVSLYAHFLAPIFKLFIFPFIFQIEFKIFIFLK